MSIADAYLPASPGQQIPIPGYPASQEAALGLEPGTAGSAFNDDDNDEAGRDTAEQRAARAAEAAARPPIYNAEGLHEKLEDISWPAEVCRPSCDTLGCFHG